MKSVRLDPVLEAKLDRAARAMNVSQSQFIRDALIRRCEETLAPSLADRCAPFIGLIKSSGGRASNTGAAFRRAIARRRAR